MKGCRYDREVSQWSRHTLSPDKTKNKLLRCKKIVITAEALSTYLGGLTDLDTGIKYGSKVLGLSSRITRLIGASELGVTLSDQATLQEKSKTPLNEQLGKVNELISSLTRDLCYHLGAEDEPTQILTHGPCFATHSVYDEGINPIIEAHMSGEDFLSQLKDSEACERWGNFAATRESQPTPELHLYGKDLCSEEIKSTLVSHSQRTCPWLQGDETTRRVDVYTDQQIYAGELWSLIVWQFDKELVKENIHALLD